MNLKHEIKTSWQTIPAELKTFLKRAVLIFIVWNLGYHLFLLNGRVIDKPLTDFSSKSTGWVLQFFYPSSMFLIKEKVNQDPELPNNIQYADYLYKDGRSILGIADACNALELYILYVGFLIAFPGTCKRKVFFSITGLITIYISNIVRLVALSAMNMHRINAMDMAHHYIFKLIVYTIIFGLWMAYAGKKADEKVI